MMHFADADYLRIAVPPPNDEHQQFRTRVVVSACYLGVDIPLWDVHAAVFEDIDDPIGIHCLSLM